VQIEELTLLAERADHDAVRLGCLKAKLEVIERRLALLQAVGLLPRDLGALRLELEIRHVLPVFVDVLDRFHVPPEALEELQARLGRGHSGNGRASALPAGA
jgi:hypothetical protein